ncbi:MAG: ThuA domain-containing protein [Rhodothermaceae bacterium]|nr:ThuA domain-containing protein [Rhodothermaceae bacterium]MXW33663.1 ThuA domain-containing protein [Rhodothermaceae bacterium]MXZ18251.1 ThuA domain-containing protein [Rhodothermaceae bacterium]MYC03721.1 ThuA domain-containing protein [Rhodothermaceae bacterium]MYE61731.1 ThuA domain-containing protein [Rhodothermaceae bacterium]
MRTLLIVVLGLFLAGTGTAQTPSAPHIVFVTGDEEYRSEESMPMLARILKRDYGFEVSICYALNEEGFIDPNVLDNIEGLEQLEDADMMVLFTRFRALPDSQAHYILKFAESGKPMVGFRTTTHAFLYKDDAEREHLNNDWPTRVFGQQWITHHGHFDDGEAPLTRVEIAEQMQSHPILSGVTGFGAYSWLYHVDGGDWKLHGNSEVLLNGTALLSNHANAGRLDQFPLTNPVAWTKTYTGASGVPAKVFFTTLGHPYDFKDESMRKLALNGILWALDHEIPDGGANAEPVLPYEPNNSGFGDKFKPNMRPAEL